MPGTVPAFRSPFRPQPRLRAFSPRGGRRSNADDCRLDLPLKETDTGAAIPFSRSSRSLARSVDLRLRLRVERFEDGLKRFDAALMKSDHLSCGVCPNAVWTLFSCTHFTSLERRECVANTSQFASDSIFVTLKLHHQAFLQRHRQQVTPSTACASLFNTASAMTAAPAHPPSVWHPPLATMRRSWLATGRRAPRSFSPAAATRARNVPQPARGRLRWRAAAGRPRSHALRVGRADDIYVLCKVAAARSLREGRRPDEIGDMRPVDRVRTSDRRAGARRPSMICAWRCVAVAVA